jgi:predicted alpha/beta superfamily hydrolase
MIRILLLTVLLLGSTLAAADSAPLVTLEHTEHRTLRSDKIGQTYDLFVSLPADYATSGKTYPVLYVLDGWHFPFFAYLQNNNLYSERMRPVIFVTIGHGANGYLPLRARDFTPTPTDQEPTSGGAAEFLGFLEQDIIPWVDRTYRTDPNDRGLLGHSYGGLFALYTLEERPGLFQRIVAASPVAGWDNNLLLKAAAAKLAGIPHPVRLDLSAGDDQDTAEETRAFAAELARLKPVNLEYRCTIYPGENHNSVRFASFPPGLYWVYQK